jgi:hypothetical protein
MASILRTGPNLQALSRLPSKPILLHGPLLAWSEYGDNKDVAKLSQQKSEKLKAVVSGLQELRAKDQRISEEKQKNIYLQRELDKLKLERM